MILGGNLTSIRQSVSNPDFEARANLLNPGDVARVNILFHEIFWSKDPTKWDFSIVGQMLKICNDRKLIPVIVCTAGFHPASEWYADKPYNDWWLPREDLWPDVYHCIDLLLSYISSQMVIKSTVSTSTLSKDWYYQIHNEPAKGKPGGSIVPPHAGQWSADHHRFWYGMMPTIKKYVKFSRTISPAISCFLEGGGGYNFIAEQATCIPSGVYNWRQYCGITAYHLRIGVSWAQGNLDVFKQGMDDLLDLFNLSQNKGIGTTAGTIAFTELYLTQGDAGKPLGSDTTPEKVAALNSITKMKNIAFITTWGLLDEDPEEGLKGNVWFEYGGWGKALKQFRTASPTTPPINPTSPPSTK